MLTIVLLLWACGFATGKLATSPPATSAKADVGRKCRLPAAVSMRRPAPIERSRARQKASSWKASPITPTLACWRTLATAATESERSASSSVSSQASANGMK